MAKLKTQTCKTSFEAKNKFNRQKNRQNIQRKQTLNKNQKKKLEKHFGKHESLTKAQSFLLVQTRTEKIGLKRFLFQRKVPEISTSLCRCGQAEETVWHVLSGCTSSDAADAWLDFESPAKLMKRLKEKEKVGPILGCLAKRLAKYRLAEKLEDIQPA